jgi:hypothetical protein
MLSLARILRRPDRAVAFDERTGEVCTAACRAASSRAADLDRALRLRGPR